MPDAAVVTAVARTPFGRFGGALASFSAPEIGALALDEVLRRSGLPPDRIDALYAGVGMIGGATLSPTRQALLRSLLPETVPSFGVDRACCSGMTAIALGWKDIRLGLADAVLCGGFEALSATPRLLPRTAPTRPGTILTDDPLLLRAPMMDRQIAVYTGEEAIAHGVSREDQDRWALQSHARYFTARDRGFFAAECFPVTVPDARSGDNLLVHDESPRSDSSLEKLARLAPVYGGLTVTAGNAPGLNDGAAFLMLMSEQAARAAGAPVLARITDYAQIAGGPTSGTSTPAHAIGRILREQGLTLHDIDLFEINEAYAATPLVSTSVLAGGDAGLAERLRARTNIHGGAVAIGHPLGASGCRIIMALIAALMGRGGGGGIGASCGGFGQGDALLVEVGR